ncbi:class I SAM-dependent methyltransferase [Ammoniphilus sp. CFH 90114]|uniref:class I SAM-dependent methyltransferase n=1 Tax=Ammoniphilus sp. CFH 90114 TaxID=2493665 RepID=UPI00100FCF62|nr:class I SAM-dependent methyltransferase [Ammoniphilus sp. CFH 90114]RXT15204.1 SAM-dependent methyltransferase [Ammoniphilus sp. CFH 90114]
MIITTSQRVNQELINKAQALAERVNGTFVSRRERSIRKFYIEEKIEQFLVVSKDRIQWYAEGNERPFFFHPGMSAIRIKRLLGGDNDIMIQTCQLQSGDSMLDCTMGLGADSLVASFVVGETGRVVGIESEPMIALLVEEGLKELELFKELDEAARRIEVIAKHHLEVLQRLPSKSFDVVYFDPMFRQSIAESTSLQVLRGFANPSPLETTAIQEAVRVARRRVVLKERRDSREFDRLGFTMIYNENKEVAYGILEV